MRRLANGRTKAHDLMQSAGRRLNSQLMSGLLDNAGSATGQVVGPWSSTIRKAPGSSFNVSGRLLLGYNRGGLPRDMFANEPASIHLDENATFTADGFVYLGPGVRIAVGSGAHFQIGSDSYITASSSVFCEVSIKIGFECAISWGVQIMDSDFHSLGAAGIYPPSMAPIVLGNHVWVGSRSTILKGVNIGDHAVIAAGSVVTRDVPSHALVAGIPAKILKSQVEWKMDATSGESSHFLG